MFATCFSYTFDMERIFANNPIPSVAISQVFSPASKFPDFGSLVNILLKNALVVAGIICLVLLILGGFGFIVSAGGDAKAKEKGKNMITSALTGLILIIAAYWIIEIIQIILGVNILNPGI